MNYNVLKKIFPYENCKNINNLKYDSEGLWSITHPDSANLISNKIKLFEKSGLNTNVILDATAGLGGNVLSFAKYFKKVIAVEYDKDRFKYLENNINNYNYNNIEIYNEDSVNLLSQLNKKIDVVFVDPPWGGPDYKYLPNLEIKLGNLDMKDLCYLISEYSYENNKIKLLVFKLPYNYDYQKIINQTKNKIKISEVIKDGNIIYLFIMFN